MHKKFEINQTNVKAGCQSGRKVVTHNSNSNLSLVKMEKISKTNIQKKSKYPDFFSDFLDGKWFLIMVNICTPIGIPNGAKT